MPITDPDARREYHRAYMRARLDDPDQRDAQRARVADWSRRRREWFRSLKAGLTCGGCGAGGTLHFHHRPGSTKLFDVANGVRLGKSRDAILAEIAKCDVLCADCHQRRHSRRGGGT